MPSRPGTGDKILLNFGRPRRNRGAAGNEHPVTTLARAVLSVLEAGKSWREAILPRV